MLERMPDEMSGGQRQRVAIARALVREPDVFLMDEPLANLDAKLRVHMRTELQRLHRRLETTIVYVTHDQAEAMTMSDRIAVINAGSLQQIAPPLECYNEPANLFVAGFIGSPSMNFVEAVVTDDSLETENFTVEFDPSGSDLVSGDEVIVGVRPEDVYLEHTAGSVSHPTAPFDARVDVMEPMGNEIFVYLVTGDEGEGSQMDIDVEDDAPMDDQLLMSVDPDTDIQIDDEVSVVLDRSSIHLFDPDTSQATRHGIVEPPTGTSGAAERGVGDTD
jgi:multiple sugar transport system ATP-binding protein